MSTVEVKETSSAFSASSVSLSASTTASATSCTAALIALSRNASVISSSSSNSSSSSLLLNNPQASRVRTFSSPRAFQRARKTTLQACAKGANAPIRNDVQSPRKAARSVTPGPRVGRDDFEFGEVLGEGSYSTVMTALYPPTQKAYAVKVIDKEPLVRRNLTKIAAMERNTLTHLANGQHPGIVRLYWKFQDQWCWYFILDLVPNGSLLSWINRLGSLSVPCSRIYTAQIIDAVAWMHSRGVVHRDLKPENILLDEHMRVKIVDFGSSKVFDVEKEDDKSNAWLCSPHFVPPELLVSQVTCRASDFWAVGCILYQMISGKLPFQGASHYLMWIDIKALKYDFPYGFDGPARDLVQRFLTLEPEIRLGAGYPGTLNDLAALRAHPFFKSFSWSTLWTDPIPPLEAGLVIKDSKPEESRCQNIQGQDQDQEDYATEWRRAFPSSVSHGGNSFEDSGTNGTSNAVISGSAVVLESDSSDSDSVPTPRFSPPSSIPSTPTRRLSGLLETFSLASRSRRSSTTTKAFSFTLLNDPQRWSSLLRPTEIVIFSSCVHKGVPNGKLSFPRQIMSSVSATGRDKGIIKGKVKLRLLVLTKMRLVCLKEKDGEVVMTDEVLLGSRGGAFGVLVGVEKNEQGFSVQTPLKTYCYATEDATLATRWIKEIESVIPVDGTNPMNRTIMPDRTRS